jgi:hypothetical protein
MACMLVSADFLAAVDVTEGRSKSSAAVAVGAAAQFLAYLYLAAAGVVDQLWHATLPAPPLPSLHAFNAQNLSFHALVSTAHQLTYPLAMLAAAVVVMAVWGAATHVKSFFKVSCC